jgi:hypothetical protein
MKGPERLEHLKLCGIDTSAEALIEAEVDRLLAALYIPVVTDDGRLIYQRDPVRCDIFGLEDELINWGDLKCAQVDAFADGRYRVIIEEASPSECPTLCNYVSHHLRPNGWTCEVSTEW